MSRPDQQPAEGFDPQELRARLHQSVEGLAPPPAALTGIRTGVRRRLRVRRLAATGSACVVVVGVAAFAVLSPLSGLPGSQPTAPGPGDSQLAGPDGRSGSGEVPLGTASAGPGPRPLLSSASPLPGGEANQPVQPFAAGQPEQGQPGGGPAPGGFGAASVPGACRAADLRTSAAWVHAAAVRGVGLFEYVNAGRRPCAVGGRYGRANLAVVDQSNGRPVRFAAGRGTAQGMAQVPADQQLTIDPGSAVRFQYGWTASGPGSGNCSRTRPDDPLAYTWAVTVHLTGDRAPVSTKSPGPMCQGTLYVSGFYRPGGFPDPGLPEGTGEVSAMR